MNPKRHHQMKINHEYVESTYNTMVAFRLPKTISGSSWNSVSGDSSDIMSYPFVYYTKGKLSLGYSMSPTDPGDYYWFNKDDNEIIDKILNGLEHHGFHNVTILEKQVQIS